MFGNKALYQKVKSLEGEIKELRKRVTDLEGGVARPYDGICWPEICDSGKGYAVPNYGEDPDRRTYPIHPDAYRTYRDLPQVIRALIKVTGLSYDEGTRGQFKKNKVTKRAK